MQHTFLYISLALFCTTTTWNQKLPSYTFYGVKVVCGLVTFFFAAAHLYLGGRQHFSISHSRYNCFYISGSSSFSVIHANVDIKIKSKERIRLRCCCCFFISKSAGGYAIYRQNARVLEMQNLTPAYMKGWTYVRTYSARTILWPNLVSP